MNNKKHSQDYYIGIVKVKLLTKYGPRKRLGAFSNSYKRWIFSFITEFVVSS